jgi:hypothetical protein
LQTNDNPNAGVYSMSVKFFRSDGTICMFDPETFKIHLYQGAGWVESDDPELREDIRFRSVELSRDQALQLSRA